MKKKGFTLVELLAVIAILAILVVIAMPNVLGMFNSSKKNTFVTEVQNMLKQAATDYVTASLEGYQDDGYIFTTEDATKKKLNIETSKHYNIQLDSQGNVIKAQVWDTTFCYSAVAEYETKSDGSKVLVTPIKYTAVKAESLEDYKTDGSCKQ